MGPIAQVLGKPKYQVLTEQGFGLMLLGPTPLTLEQTKINGANHQLWAGLGGPIMQSWNNSKTAPISEFRRDVFSKRNRAIFPTSGNFQNYLFN